MIFEKIFNTSLKVKELTICHVFDQDRLKLGTTLTLKVFSFQTPATPSSDERCFFSKLDINFDF